MYIHDCGVEDVQELSYANLEEALNVHKTVLSDKNTMCTIQFAEKLPDVKEIAFKALSEKARNILEPPVSFLGIKGMRKLAKEFNMWEQELSTEEYREALMNIVMFTGTVPLLPDALLKPEERSGIPHKAAREKLVQVLDELSARYTIDVWKQSAREFEKSGDLLSHITDRISDYLLGNCGNLSDIPNLICKIADIEEKAFLSILNGTRS